LGRWQIELLANSRNGLVSGTATFRSIAICGCDGFFRVSGQYTHPDVDLDFESDGFTLGPSFSGTLVHPDSIVGVLSGAPITFVR